jgi:thiol-disulfide isomerase/thioredoxin
LEQAVREGKRVLVEFYAPWCVWCRKLEEETLRDPQVRQGTADLLHLRVNTDEDRPLADRFGVKSLPTVLLLDGSERVLGRVEGFLPPELFLSELHRSEDSADPKADASPAPPATPGLENPLPELSKRMWDVKGMLEREETGPLVERKQEEIISRLDELIERASQASSSNSSSSRQRQQGQEEKRNTTPAQAPASALGEPMPDSRLPSGSGGAAAPGAFDTLPAERWGSLPPGQRERLRQELEHSFPAEYRELLHRYYEMLNKDVR